MIYLIAATCFALRAIPRVVCPNAYFSDTYFHLYCARVIRAHGFALPKRLPRIVLAHEHTYPFLYHYLLALLPDGARRHAERLTGAVFDTLIVVLAWLFTTWLIGRGWPDRDSNLADLVAVSIALSPALLRIGSGPRAYNGSPRLVGQFSYLVHLCAAYYAFATASPWGAFASMLAGAVVVLTAKFSVQVMVLYGAAFSLFVTPYYVLLVLLAIGASTLLSGGRSLRIMVGHYRHSRFYLSFLQGVFLHPYKTTLVAYLGKARGSVLQAMHGGWRGMFQWFFTERHPVHLLVTVFTPFLLLPAWLHGYADYPPDARFLAVWASAGFFWYVATSTRRLSFLGEGERYLEYALLPATLLAILTLGDERRWIFHAFVAYSAAATVWYLLEYRSRFRASSVAYAEGERALARLANLPAGVVMPVGSHHWEALYRTQFPVLTIGVNIDETLLPREEFALVYGSYPYPSGRFDEIVARYEVRYVLSDKAALDHYAGAIVGDAARVYSRLEPVAEAPGMVIFRVLHG